MEEAVAVALDLRVVRTLTGGERGAVPRRQMIVACASDQRVINDPVATFGFE